MPTDMKLPELGENIEGGDVLRVMVKPGDAIKKDQAVLELETDKATIEVPSSVAGVVKEVKIKPGEKVKVGQTIFVVDENGAGGGAARSLKRNLQNRARRRQPAEQSADAAPVAPKPAATEPAKADEARKAKSRRRRDEAVQAGGRACRAASRRNRRRRTPATGHRFLPRRRRAGSRASLA